MKLFDEFIESKYLKIISPDIKNKEKMNRLIIALNAQKIVNHLIKFIKRSSKNIPSLFLDPVKNIKSCMDMRAFLY